MEKKESVIICIYVIYLIVIIWQTYSSNYFKLFFRQCLSRTISALTIWAKSKIPAEPWQRSSRDRANIGDYYSQ